MSEISASIPFWSGDVGGIIDPDSLSVWNTYRQDGHYFPDPTAPFIVKSIRGSVGFDIDRRKRKNRSGKKKTGTGAKSPQWTVSFIFWTPEQYRAWRAILPQINPKLAANRIKSRRVYHPFLDDYEITQGTIYHLDIPQWDDKLIAEVTLYYEEVDDSDVDQKKSLKKTSDPNDALVAIDQDFISDDGPPPSPR